MSTGETKEDSDPFCSKVVALKYAEGGGLNWATKPTIFRDKIHPTNAISPSVPCPIHFFSGTTTRAM